MKRFIIALAFALVCISCANNKKAKEAETPVMEIVNGERSTYGVLESCIYLPTQDSTGFDVKVYQGEEGLMLESPKILTGNLFGIKSNTGPLDRIKYEFDFIGKSGEMYLYGISYLDFPARWGNYYTMNLDYCWIYFQFDDMSNSTKTVEFSKAEFENLFDVVKAHIVN